MASSAPINAASRPRNGDSTTTTLPRRPQGADHNEMSGFKRDHQGNEKKAHHDGPKKPFGQNRQQKTVVPVVRNAYTPMFEHFRDELDQHHERRERIVKASRDITALSKKVIFALQRVRKIHEDLPADIQKDMDARLDQISALLATMAPDVQGINRYRYSNSLSCIEELIEALTFAHYLKTQSLVGIDDLSVTIEELARRGAASQDDTVMADADTDKSEAKAKDPADAPVVSITEQDYLYGVFDLTGEMMRFATTSTALTRELARGEDDGQSAKARTILHDMQDLRSFFEMLPQNKTKPWRSKLDVLRQSVLKVEKIGYGMTVRGSERESGWVPDGDEDGGLVE